MSLLILCFWTATVLSPYFLKNDLKSLKEIALKMIPKYWKTFFFYEYDIHNKK